jgi:hypothetical protein
VAAECVESTGDCEVHGIPLKAFGNSRAKFKAEPQPLSPKLLYRRRLSHTLSHVLSHMTYDRAQPIVPPARQASNHDRILTGAGMLVSPSGCDTDGIATEARRTFMPSNVHRAAAIEDISLFREQLDPELNKRE